MIVDGKLMDDLDATLPGSEQTEVIFIRIMPLVGG